MESRGLLGLLAPTIPDCDSPQGIRWKGPAFYAFNNRTIDFYSAPMDVREFSTVLIWCLVTGTNPVATIDVELAPEPGGPWITRYAGGSVRVVSANDCWAAATEGAFCRFHLKDISGSFLDGQGFTVVAQACRW